MSNLLVDPSLDYFSQHYELYRRSTLGMTLTDSLDEMVTNGKLTPTIAMKVLAQFDKVRSSCSDSSILVTLFAVLPLKCMNEALKNVKTKTTFKVCPHHSHPDASELIFPVRREICTLTDFVIMIGLLFSTTSHSTQWDLVAIKSPS